MLKYVESDVVFQEVPDEITLAINISGCTVRCPDCHSKHLWDDVGHPLTVSVLNNLITKNKGITCVAFMGGSDEIFDLAKWIKTNTDLKVCWYTGRTEINDLT